MLIILGKPSFTHGGKVIGTLTARQTIALKVDGGVITFDRDDVLKMLPALTAFAESPDPEGNDGGVIGFDRADVLKAFLPTLTTPAERPAQDGDE